MTTVADVMTRGVRSMSPQVSLGDISTPAEPDRSGQTQASGPAGGGSASGKPRRKG